MKINTKLAPVRTHEGGIAHHITPLQELRRTVLAHMLWEDSFYENGQAIAGRIEALVAKVSPNEVADLAIEAREKMNLRHVPLLLVRELARTPSRCSDGLISKTLGRVIKRADELAEFVAIYWKDKRQPLSKQVKKGLARAFHKFDEYQLAKYNRDGAIKLRDVLFMCHAKPANDMQAELWQRLISGQLATPDTWEVALSDGADKKAAFERLMTEGKLGYMALLRNLRNMQEAGVDMQLAKNQLLLGAEKSKALPFRYVAAARVVPSMEPTLDMAMQASMKGMPRLTGSTILLVDVSGSMDRPVSAKSDLTRLDAASALAALARGICDDVRVFTFSNQVVEVAARHGMALIDAIDRSQPHGGTYLRKALEDVRANASADRIIVITDEQSHDGGGAPIGRGYMINVGTSQNGVGYGQWTNITGFSEAVVQYIQALEETRASAGN